LTFRRPSRVWQVLFFFALGGSALAAVFVAASLKLPYDSPRARMYRTEAEMAGLAQAIESYKEANGSYPPPGAEGLRRATEHLSRVKDFYPDGPPPDGWGRPYFYVPHTEYEKADFQAQRCGEGWCAPSGFQLFSAGADGKPGTEDDITSWDELRLWRDDYR